MLLGNCTSGGKGGRRKAVRECTKRPGRERSGKQSAPRIHNGVVVAIEPTRPLVTGAHQRDARAAVARLAQTHDENRLGHPPARDRARAEAARGDSAARGVGM